MTKAHMDDTGVTLDLKMGTPFGCVLTSSHPGADVRSIPVSRLRELTLQHRVLILRGFELFPSEEELVAYCSTWGELLKWNFGHVFNLFEHEDPKNYLFTSGSVSFHWDGAFAEAVPSFQFFQCLQAPPTDTGGETLFADTIRVLDTAPKEVRERWAGVNITYLTEKVAHYGGRIVSPLLGRHPHLDVATLRYAEPPNADTVRLNELSLEVAGVEPGEVETFLRDLDARLYDPSNCYAHRWQQGDMLLADNHALLHGRTAFKHGAPRRLQRVHIL
jgi:alpha-ketoglutarate-dependent taurine dioxygenase